jgi:hypothetical protein
MAHRVPGSWEAETGSRHRLLSQYLVRTNYGKRAEQPGRVWVQPRTGDIGRDRMGG